MDRITLVSKGASLSISDEKLLIEFDRDMNSLSTALWAGGYRSIRSALNQKLTGYYESLQDFPGGSVESYLKICAEEVTESPEKCPSLLTAARVRLYSHKVLSAGGMTIEAVTTGGVEKTACRASSPALYREEDEHFFPVGTINMMIIASGFLPEGVMARALITLTEGKSAALQDLGIADVNNGLPATGTCTDGITIICDPEGKKYTDAGSFSLLGSLLSKAAYESVRDCIETYDHPWNASSLLRTPPAQGIDRLRKLSEKS